MGATIIEKIWNTHVVLQEPGLPAVFAIDLMLIHEVTSAQAFDTLRAKGLQPTADTSFVATLDHSIPTRPNRLEIYDAAAKKQVETLRSNCKEFGIPLYDFESGHQGVVHVIGPELGLTHPGMTIVCGDSHTSTHGAFGALAFGVGTSEVGHVLATGCLLQQRPKTMRVKFTGKLPAQTSAKDMILRLIAEIGAAGGTGYVIEYAGEAIEALSMEGRMTICNMSIECGARAGLIAPDDVTFAYLKGKQFQPSGAAWDSAVQSWRELPSDADATFDREIVIDVSTLEPMVTWGINPGQGCGVSGAIPSLESLDEKYRASAVDALAYVDLEPGTALRDVAIDWAFIGSCTNGRIEDLRAAAQVLRGRKVHSAVTLYVVPGSEAVRAQAIAEGLDRVFIDAGADFRMPGCSMCLAMNDDKVPVGKRCISSSNRNFIGRQGPGSRTHLASPTTVAASAVVGKITAASSL
jgi:3-isopropylmalate/(R)-2-methylmalate dehydratase large subunit